MKKETIQNKIQDKIYHTDDKIINALTIIVDSIMLIIFVLTLILKNDIIYALYWMFISLFLLADIISIMHWDVEGLKTERKESDKMIRSFRDVTAITIVLSGLGYLTVIFLEMINKSISKNVYAIVILFGLLAITQLFNRLTIHSNIRDASKFAKDFYKKNNKEK